MNKIEFKNAVKKSKPMVWMNMFDENFYEIVGVNIDTFDRKNWEEKPINIVYLDTKDNQEKDGNAHLCEIELSENIITTPKNKRYGGSRGARAKTDESITPSSSTIKITNNKNSKSMKKITYTDSTSCAGEIINRLNDIGVISDYIMEEDDETFIDIIGIITEEIEITLGLDFSSEFCD
jgi:hypothetical protein